MEDEDDYIECLACGKDCNGECDRRYEDARDALEDQQDDKRP